MPINKNAFIRYKALDKCFRNFGKRYFMEDLIEACNEAIYEFEGNKEGIKKRQIFNDIRFMESDQGWSITLDRLKDGRQVYYRYADQNFSINSQPLNHEEENHLREALLTLSRFKGMPQFEWVDELIVKLETGLNLRDNSQKVIEFEQNQYLKGLEFISPLFDAIQNKVVLSIAYQSFNNPNKENISFSPYYLKQYNNRWFVFGQDHDYSSISNLALDRIINLEEKTTKYKEPEIDFEEYFEDVIGVTVLNTPLETVKLKTDNSLLPYIETKPLHGSQKIKERLKDYSIIELRLIPNYEFESILLSNADKLIVIEPASLKLKIQKRLNQAINNYAD